MTRFRYRTTDPTLLKSGAGEIAIDSAQRCLASARADIAAQVERENARRRPVSLPLLAPPSHWAQITMAGA